MGWKWVALVLERSQVGPVARMVLVAIAERINRQGYAWPSLSDLARRSGADRRTVARSLRHLEARGELRIERHDGRPNRYQLTLAERPAADQGQSAPTRGRAPLGAERHGSRGRAPLHQGQSAPRTGKEPVKRTTCACARTRTRAAALRGSDGDHARSAHPLPARRLLHDPCRDARAALPGLRRTRRQAPEGRAPPLRRGDHPPDAGRLLR
jgi:DNA-binding MarR family transcriptional regulator